MMTDDLLPYYERELASLRALAWEFAERYPKVARRLQIDRELCEDPHAERLIEAFALLAARIHRKLDDDYPELTEAFLQVMYPHFLRPLPSATILQLADPGEPCTVPRHTPVFAPAIQGVSCQFRTSMAVDLWPLRVAQARIELTQAAETAGPAAAEAVITLELATLDGRPIGSLGLDRLRFFLDGAPPLMHLLYELLLFRVQEVRAADPAEPARSAVLPGQAVRAVGFEPGEELFGADARSFPGFRLLAEYLAFPEKFMFFELAGLDAPGLAGCGATLRLRFMISPYGAGERHLRLLQSLSAADFKLGCVPIVNLFRHPGAPVRVSHRQLSYPVAADNRNPGAFEVCAIDSVTRAVPGQGPEATEEVPPFYALGHGGDGGARFYWYASRERGGPLELALVDLDFQPVRPEAEILSLQLTCSNRDLPAAIPFGGGGFQESFSIPSQPAVKQARPLRKPTPSLGPPAKPGLQWPLISHLALNHLALAAHGPAGLQELLELYNFTGSPAVARQIQGIAGLSASPATARLPGQAFAAFVRGAELTLTLDEQCFVGSNLFLFASVLERFFAHACPANSFVRLRLTTLQQESEVARWPPRTGETPLI